MRTLPSKSLKRLRNWTLVIVFGGLAANQVVSSKPAGLTSSVIGGGTVFAAPEPRPTVSAPLIGDTSFRGELDLGKMKKNGDVFEVALPAKRRAVLTIEPAIQAKANKVLAKSGAREGAVVVLGLDGRVLAIAGRRNEAPKGRDFRLALEVWAPAASIFKLVTGAALLESGVRADKEVCYHGGFRSVEKSNLTDNSRLDRDCGDLTAGVARSQNAIVAKLATKHLERDELFDTAARLGFDSAPNFALDTEANRFELPSDRLELARVAAGFWSSELSVLGAALLTHSIASGGLRVAPRIVAEVRGPGGTKTVLSSPTERVLSAKVAKALGEMMEDTCTVGTARSAFKDRKGRPFLGGAKVAGKTGSLSVETPTYRGYSWFVGYAPADKPVAIIAVLLANPPKWHLKAHTAARLVLEAVL